jgi:hypothetical protein
MLLRPSVFTVIYLVVGIVVAAVNDYFDSLGTIGRIISAIIAVLIWPLILIGFDVQVSR